MNISILSLKICLGTELTTLKIWNRIYCFAVKTKAEVGAFSQISINDFFFFSTRGRKFKVDFLHVVVATIEEFLFY